jgi:NTP pyrophosphatase (non-canonical NTP hydrolase)
MPCCDGSLKGILIGFNDTKEDRKMNEQRDVAAQMRLKERMLGQQKIAAAESDYSSGANQPWPAQGNCASAEATRVASPLDDAAKLLAADKEHRSLAADQALLLGMVIPTLKVSLNQLSMGIYRWNEHQGFWVNADNGQIMTKGEKIALMHSELSECLEAIRGNIPWGEKGCESEELADLFIRLMDYCGRFGIDLARAVHEKQLKNLQRPFRHGKGF